MLKTSYTSAQYLNPANSLTYAYGKINAVVIADIDGNGFTDLVTFPSNFTTFPELQPLVWSNTNGVFSARPDLVSGPSSYQYFRDAVPGDFTGDGITDYLMMDTGFELDNRNTTAFKYSQPKFYVGTGSGLKSIPTNEFLVAGNNSATFNHIGASADFNGDGKLDAVIASFNHLRILVNDGQGHFTTREDLVPVKFNNSQFFASGTSFIRLGSAYGLVAGAYRYYDPNIPMGDLAVMTQQNGVFVETQTLPRPNLGQGRERNYGAVDMTNIDVNNDGREDLVVTWETESFGGFEDGLRVISPTYTENSYPDLSMTVAVVYFQNAMGQLVIDPRASIYNLGGAPGKGSGAQIYFRDFNNDGYVDFWNTTYGIHPTRFNDLVWYNDGTGHFATNSNGPFKTTESFPDYVLLAPFFFDANNDGVVDVVATTGVFPEPPTRTIGEQVRVFLGIDPVIKGTAQADRLVGTSDADSMQGLAGNDTLTGLAGNDTLDGGAGDDSMVGGLGDDTYYVDSTGDKVVELDNQGTDTVVSDISLSLAKFANVENWVGIGSADISATGNAVGNALTGNSGSNTIDGGLGIDTLTGGAGADRFVFSSKLGATNTDTITDFVSGVDKIQLSKSVFSKFKAGAVAQANFVSGGANTKALDSNDYLIFNGSQLLYDADGSGKGVAVVVANIVGTVVASDLVVV